LTINETVWMRVDARNRPDFLAGRHCGSALSTLRPSIQ
jgi:hypothetical protein